MKLVLAEKPSVAQSIAKVLGAAKREDGYLEGNGYVISWCVGHLVELAQIVAGWAQCKLGKYIMERHLKKGTVFILEDDQKVYMVKGLVSSWEEMLGKGPVLLDAVLLPFRDSIISDGLVVSYPVSFGRGISDAFKRIYMDAKTNGTICFSFSDSEPKSKPQKKTERTQVESYVIKVCIHKILA